MRTTRTEPSGPDGAFAAWRFEDVELHEASRELRVAGKLVDIEPRAFDMLIIMLRRAGEVVTAEEFITSAWAGRIVNDSSITNVTNAVSKLRKLLKDDKRKIITTVPKIGYRFSAKVEQIRYSRQTQSQILKQGDSVPGRTNWKLAERLQNSGFGDIWLGVNSTTNDRRIFKFCDDLEKLTALKRESILFRVLRETLAEQAPVPALLERQFETLPFYTEAECWGQDLHRWAEQQGGLSNVRLDTRIEVLALAAEAVTAINSVGVLHNNLNPQNILVFGTGEALQVRLRELDTGQLLDHPALEALDITEMGVTNAVSNVGTTVYSAPESRTGGAPSVQADVYSLGILLYQLIVGEWLPLGHGWEADIADELLRQDIADCINRDRKQRLPSTLLLVQRLRSLAERREQSQTRRQAEARQAVLEQALQRARARWPWIVAAASVLLCTVVTGMLLMLKTRGCY